MLRVFIFCYYILEFGKEIQFSCYRDYIEKDVCLGCVYLVIIVKFLDLIIKIFRYFDLIVLQLNVSLEVYGFVI